MSGTGRLEELRRVLAAALAVQEAKWLPAEQCPPDETVVAALFSDDSDDDEPCYVRKLPNGWTNIAYAELHGDNPITRWRPLITTERTMLEEMFPAWPIRKVTP